MNEPAWPDSETLRGEADRLYQERVRYRDLNARAATIEGSVLLLVLAGLTQASADAWAKIQSIRDGLILLLVAIALFSVFRVFFVQWRLRVVAERADAVRRGLGLPILPGAGWLGYVWAWGAAAIECGLAALLIYLVAGSIGPAATVSSAPPTEPSMTDWIQAVAAVVVGIAGVWIAVVQTRSQKQQLTAERRRLAVALHSAYYDASYYREVSGPTAVIKVRWFELPEKDRDGYRDAVLSGWIPDEGRWAHAYPESDLAAGVDHARSHMRDPVEPRVLTEHQRLSAYIRGLTQLASLYESDAVDRDVMGRLFGEALSYRYWFLTDFCRSLRERASRAGREPPAFATQIPQFLDQLRGAGFLRPGEPPRVASSEVASR